MKLREWQHECKRISDGRKLDHHALQVMGQQAVWAVREGQTASSVAKSAYLMAVGGVAYLVSKAIKNAGFDDRVGMEAIHDFDVRGMLVTVAVESNGASVHNTGPKEW